MNIEELKNKIDKAILEVKNNGWRIEPGMWVSCYEGHCCPLGATFISAVGSPTPKSILKGMAYEAELHIPYILKIQNSEVCSFAEGFDGAYYENDRHVKEYYDLGKAYREIYVR
jgi:hypothetical protein